MIYQIYYRDISTNLMSDQYLTIKCERCQREFKTHVDALQETRVALGKKCVPNQWCGCLPAERYRYRIKKNIPTHYSQSGIGTDRKTFPPKI